MVRFKDAYAVCRVEWKGGRAAEPPGEAALLAGLRGGVGAAFGAAGLARAQAALQVKFFDARSGVFVLRCDRADFRRVWASATLLTELCRTTCAVRVVRRSGSLRACKAAARAELADRLAALGAGAEALRAAHAQVDAISL